MTVYQGDFLFCFVFVLFLVFYQITISESQIIDSVDNHFGEYLWRFLVVRLYSWHNSNVIKRVLLRHNKGKAGKFYIIIITDRFYIALFSAFEQTHCARMWFYMSI